MYLCNVISLEILRQASRAFLGISPVFLFVCRNAKLIFLHTNNQVMRKKQLITSFCDTRVTDPRERYELFIFHAKISTSQAVTFEMVTAFLLGLFAVFDGAGGTTVYTRQALGAMISPDRFVG